MTKLLSAILLFSLSACGGSGGGSKSVRQQEEQVPSEPDAIQGVFRADLKAINSRVNGHVEGQVLIRLQGDNFEANIVVRNVPGSVHRQVIHQLKSCPDISADTNGDRIISAAEASIVSGGVFIPLDDDLDNNDEGGRYPNGGFVRAYVYQQKASRSRLLQELGPGVKFDLQDKVVMIYGSDDDESVPIACGELYQVTGPRR